MSTEPITFLKETFPKLFAKGIGLLEGKAEGGDATATQLLENVKPVQGAGYLVFEGLGEVYVGVKDGTVTVSDTPIEGLPIKLAARVPGDAASLVLGEAAREGALEDDRVAMGATQVASKELEDALAGQPMTCHVVVANTPDLGDVTIWLGFNVDTPPEDPKFTATVQYDDYEEMREGASNLQQAFMKGKLRMTGDYTLALQIAMQMAAKAQERAKRL